MHVIDKFSDGCVPEREKVWREKVESLGGTYLTKDFREGGEKASNALLIVIG
jgi:hypothetical protein